MASQQPIPVAERVHRHKSFGREIIETILLTAILLLVAHFSVQNFQVDGTSMVPTLQTGEYILVDRISYRFHAGNLPSHGDIVVFKYPLNPVHDYIKRVIGLPGDRVTIRPVAGVNHVFVNGRMLDEPYISAAPETTMAFEGCLNARTCSYTVPPHDVFVMGDNRPWSSDSREWGPVPLGNVIGRALIAYWPLSHLAFLHTQFSYASAQK